jgi:hypothetical protein
MSPFIRRFSSRFVVSVLVSLGCLFTVAPARAYSVLTHEAIIDALWQTSLVPILKARFPNPTDEQLREAHAYAYGGCLIQDLGYYPFGSHMFSDLTHYVRSADFIQSLVDNSGTLDELAFALGAAAHYSADVDGHRIAVNRSVPILYPKLRRKFGDEVTYGDDPKSHLQTEFGFDVLQVARGHYAPTAYHDFIGFQVSKDLLQRAVLDTYGLKLTDLFGSLDLALGTYRWSVRSLIPNATKTAWILKKDQIQKDTPSMARQQFLYNLSRSAYRKEWGRDYQTPGFFSRFLALLAHLLPKSGPLSGLGFKMPTPQTEQLFEESFNVAITQDRQNFASVSNGRFLVPNRDLDTGKRVSPGEYALTDKTYDALLRKLAARKFVGVTPALRKNVIAFYARMASPDPHGTTALLDQLKALDRATE